MSDIPDLPGHPTFSGSASYYDVVPGGSTVDPRIYMRLRLGASGSEFLAMVEPRLPGASWNRIWPKPSKVTSKVYRTLW